MAGDVDKKLEPLKPCCTALEKKLSKMELGRAALKQAIALMDKRIVELEAENINLKKEFEKETTRADIERKAKEKEFNSKCILEKEIFKLKSEIALLQKSECSKVQGEDELQNRVLEREVEIKRLKELLEKEKEKCDLECNKAEVEKNKVAEALELVNEEDNKAKEEKRHAEIERKKVEEYKVLLESAKLEASEAKAKLISEKLKIEEANKKEEAEKQRANQEKKRADLEALKAEEYRKLLEIERKKEMDGKALSDQLSQQLKKEKSTVEALQKLLQEAHSGAKKERKEGLHTNRERKAEENEFSSGEVLETEILKLKSEIALLQKRECPKSQDQVGLENRLLEGEAEIKNLKELLEKERKRVDILYKKAKAKKKKDIEALKLVKVEENKAEEEKRIAEIQRKNVEEFRVLLASLKFEANEAKTKLTSEKLKIKEAIRKKAEKHRANQQGKLADSAALKSEEYQKLVEVERNKAMKEKIVSDQLSQQLEKEKSNVDELKKLLQDTLFRDKKCVPLQHDNDEKIETLRDKFSCEQLKLEKMQAMRSKNISKMEKKCNKLPKTELDLLKHDVKQLARRLNLLDGCFSQCMEGTCSLMKIASSPTRQQINSSNGLSGTNSEMESLVRSSIRSMSQNSATCSSSTSLSDRQLMGSQGLGVTPIASSAVFTQESSKQGSHFKKLSDMLIEKGLSENDGEVAQDINMHRLTSLKNDYVDKLSQYNRKRKRSHGAQKVVFVHHEDKLHVKMHEVLSLLHDISSLKNMILTLCDENHDIFGNGKCLLSRPPDCLQVKKCKSSKKKTPLKRNRISLSSHQNDMQKQFGEMGNGDTTAVHFGFTTSASAANQNCENDHSCGVRAIDSVSRETDATICFENMFNGDILKLLELDDKFKEERYRIAREMPLSPNLPSIDFHECRDTKQDDLHFLFEAGHHVSLVNDEVDLASPCTIDVINVEIASNNHYLLRDREHDASSVVIEQTFVTKKQDGFVDSADHSSSLLNQRKFVPICTDDFYEVSEKNNIIDCSEKSTLASGSKQSSALQGVGFNQCQVEAEGLKFKSFSVSQSLHVLPEQYKHFNPAVQSNIELIAKSDEEAGKSMPSVTTESMKAYHLGNIGVLEGGDAKLCVVSSNVKNIENISMIICAIENFGLHTARDNTGLVGAEVICSHTWKQDLMLEEKACVFFSLLLHYTSMIALANLDDKNTGYFSFCWHIFATEINRVVSDLETRTILFELCKCNALFNLIEEFLIDRSFLIYGDASCTKLHASDSSSKLVFLGTRTMRVSYQSATLNLLEAGSVILGCICHATNNANFACEASYNIFRRCKDDISWILKALHILASICGKKYFEQHGHSSIMFTIKSMVVHLERQTESTNLLSSVHCTLASGVCSSFPSCVRCPFVDGAVSIDEVLAMLLGKLQRYSNSVTEFQNLGKPLILSIDMFQGHMEGSKGSLENGNGSDDHEKGASASISSSMSTCDAVLEDDFAANRMSSHFIDIISSLELISCYMDWEWVHINIVPYLIKLLDSHVADEFLTAVFILIGQVGRVGIDAGGYDNVEVERLRCSLLAFLGPNAGQSGLPSQFAAVKALVDLLPLDFEDLICKYKEIAIDATQSSHIQVIRTWFSRLSKSVQSSFLSLFQPPVLTNSNAEGQFQAWPS